MARSELRRITFLAWAWTFAAFTVWSLATPLWTSPDAPAHDLMAYHAVRDLSIEKTDIYANGGTSNAITRAPKGLVDSAGTVTCYAHQPVPASCITPIADDDTMVDFVNAAGRYMPLYYLATGWPSLFVPTDLAVWAERVAASALAAVFVAWAFGAVATRARRSIALTGLVVAVTPMAMYLGGAVNPNSVEITAGLALAACSVVFIIEGPETWLGRLMYRQAMVAAAVMIAVRMLAPVWVLAWAVAFALLASRRHWAHVFSRGGLPWTSVPIAAAVFSLTWIFTSGVTEYQVAPKFANTLVESLRLSKDQIDGITLKQQVGDFGWLDTPLPGDAYLLVFLVVLFLCATAIPRLGAREVVAVLWLTIAQYLLPLVMQALQWNTNGPVWQGRYTLPLTVMVPVFLLTLASERWRTSQHSWLARAYAVAALILVATHFRAILAQLRRNVSGLDGPSVLNGPWQPPLHPLVLIAAQASLLVVVAVIVVRWYAADADPERVIAGPHRHQAIPATVSADD